MLSHQVPYLRQDHLDRLRRAHRRRPRRYAAGPVVSWPRRRPSPEPSARATSPSLVASLTGRTKNRDFPSVQPAGIHVSAARSRAPTNRVPVECTGTSTSSGSRYRCRPSTRPTSDHRCASERPPGQYPTSRRRKPATAISSEAEAIRMIRTMGVAVTGCSGTFGMWVNGEASSNQSGRSNAAAKSSATAQ